MTRIAFGSCADEEKLQPISERQARPPGDNVDRQSRGTRNDAGCGQRTSTAASGKSLNRPSMPSVEKAVLGGESP